MIGYLQGTPIQFSEQQVLLNVKGVGYELACSQNSLADIEGRDFVQLWVHTHVREDQISLFGFSTQLEKKLFLSLIKVNGIGPKMAVTILSAAPFEQLTSWIEEGNVKALMKLPKVGKKKAEQIILSLKGQLVMEDVPASKNSFVAKSEITSALVHLGFRLPDVEIVVGKMNPNTDLQQGIREGLSALTNQQF